MEVMPYVFSPLGGFKPGSAKALAEAKTPDELLAAGALYGDLGTGVRLSQGKQRMLSAAGVSVGMKPEDVDAKVEALTAKFDEGKYTEFNDGLKAMLAELREMNMNLRGKPAPRQEAD
jgi:hypothetical protein